MHWTVDLRGGPRRVNHAAVALGDRIFSFGGYCSAETQRARDAIDIHVLNTMNYRWKRTHALNEDVISAKTSSDDDENTPPDVHMEEEDDVSEVDEMDRGEENAFQKSPVPYQRYGHTVVEYGGKAYLWGGRNDEFGATNVLHQFDPVTFRWSIVVCTGHAPPARDGHSAVVYDDKMYIFGGFEEEHQRFSQETFVFDFSTRQWSEMRTVGARPRWRDFHTAVCIDGCMLVFGGRSDENGEFHSTKDVYDGDLKVLDLRTSTWRTEATRGEKPCGRRSHSAWVHNGKMFIFGGFLGTENRHFNDLYRYDPQAKEWERMAVLGAGPCARRRQCTVLVRDRLFLFGGTMPINTSSSSTTTGLADLADLYVLDYFPSLYHLSAKTLIDLNLIKKYQYVLPSDITSDLANMTTDNSYSRSEA